MTNKKFIVNLPAIDLAKLIHDLSGKNVPEIVKWLKSPVGTEVASDTKKHDAVNHPDHYTKGGIECIDAMKLLFGVRETMIFCKLNAFKYLWRSKNKGSEEWDLNKWGWYTVHYHELKKELESEKEV